MGSTRSVSDSHDKYPELAAAHAAIARAEGSRPSTAPDTASMDTEACVEWLRSNADANHGWLAEAMDSDPGDPIGWLRNQVRQEWHTRAEGGAA